MKITPKKIIYFELFFVLIMNSLVSLLRFPDSIKYIPDLLNIVLFFFLLINKRNNVSRYKFKKSILIWIFLSFLLYVTINALFNLTPIYLYLWACRTLLRFFLFFYACVVFLDKKDINKMFYYFHIIFVINFILTAYEFFILRINGDYLGGIFGTIQGANTSTNVFVCIIVLYDLNAYLEKKCKLSTLISITVLALAISAMAELKTLAIEIIVVYIVSILISKPSRKTFISLSVIVIGVLIGYNLLMRIFPDSIQYFFNRMAIINYLSENYDHAYHITRMNAFHDINENFFKHSLLKELFGIGFGNGEVSAFFVSKFYTLYGSTRYRSFTFAMEYLEIGAIGLILYVSFFILIGIYAIKQIKFQREYGYVFRSVFILAFLTCFMLWYNDTTRVEIAYLLFSILSYVFIVQKDSKIN